MRAAALAVALAASTALAEPQPLPPGLQAAWILDGVGRLRIGDRVDEHLTVLPPGVYFTESGYTGLSETTEQLQVNLRELEAKLKRYEAEAIAPAQRISVAESGWSTNVLLGAFLMGAAVGLVGGTLVVARVAR